MWTSNCSSRNCLVDRKWRAILLTSSFLIAAKNQLERKDLLTHPRWLLDFRSNSLAQRWHVRYRTLILLIDFIHRFSQKTNPTTPTIAKHLTILLAFLTSVNKQLLFDKLIIMHFNMFLSGLRSLCRRTNRGHNKFWRTGFQIQTCRQR